jgi:CspA family cold shock protein
MIVPAWLCDPIPFISLKRISSESLADREAARVHILAGRSVKWFNSTKGFGFIQPDDGGQDAFVHISSVERAGLSNLVDGQKINYEIEQDRRTGKSSAGSLSKAG